MKPSVTTSCIRQETNILCKNARVIWLCKPKLFYPFLYQHQEKEDQQKEKRFSSAQFDCSPFQTHDCQAATTSTERDLCRPKHTDSIQNVSHTAFSLCPRQRSPHSSKSQDTSIASTRPSVILDQGNCDAAEKGKATNKRFLFSFWLCFISENQTKNMCSNYFTHSLSPSQERVHWKMKWCATLRPRDQPHCQSSPLFWSPLANPRPSTWAVSWSST